MKLRARTETIDTARRVNHHATKLVLLLAVGSMILSACSDSSLADLGARSSDWIGEVDTDSGSGIQAAQPIDVPDAVIWSNDDLGVPSATEPADVVAAVTERSIGGDRFIQASRFEISRALPAVAFPQRVPVEVEAITSQLVVSVGGDRLDDETYATFGMWTSEPYTKSRSVGQRGVLTIAPRTDAPACGRLAEAVQAGCSEVDLDGLRASRLDGDSGQTWIWSDETYEYRMFLRGSIESNQPAIEVMTTSLIALADVPVDDDVRVLGSQITTDDDEVTSSEG